MKLTAKEIIACVIIMLVAFLFWTSGAEKPTPSKKAVSSSSPDTWRWRSKDRPQDIPPSEKDLAPPANERRVAPAAQEHVPVGGKTNITGRKAYFGCTNIEYFDQLIGFARRQDFAAVERGLRDGLASKTCTAFNHGEAVVITDTSAFSRAVKLRREGEIKAYWTEDEAVK